MPNCHVPTPAEIRALQAVAEYGTAKAAARALSVSTATVDAHLDHLRDKTGLRYLPQLIAWAARNGYLGG